MSDLFDELRGKLTGEKRRIVFPEASDVRVLEAAARLGDEGLITPILIGDVDAVKHLASENDFDISACEVVSPNDYAEFDAMVEKFVERRKGKASTSDAQAILKDENYFGTMLVYMDKADGLVSGAAHSTADTVRPALQIIKMKEGLKKTSGVFIMLKGDEKFVFADCAINIAPDSADLAEIAVASAETATLFDIDPRVALLSFSTKGSAVSEETEKVANALAIAKEKNPDLAIDGEFQFDAAFVPSVAKKKAPDADIQGDANVFIFPSLEAGNISYKVAQRLGGIDAVGPILQGMNKPVNDLSRGCSPSDVYHLAIITAVQSI